MMFVKLRNLDPWDRDIGPKAGSILPYSEYFSNIRKSSSLFSKQLEVNGINVCDFIQSFIKNIKFSAPAEVQALRQDQYGNTVEMH